MLKSGSSYSVIVRPGQCLYTSPISNSSKHLPNCIFAPLSYPVGMGLAPSWYVTTLPIRLPPCQTRILHPEITNIPIFCTSLTTGERLPGDESRWFPHQQA